MDTDFSIDENDEVHSDQEEQAPKRRKGIDTKAYKVCRTVLLPSTSLQCISYLCDSCVEATGASVMSFLYVVANRCLREIFCTLYSHNMNTLIG